MRRYHDTLLAVAVMAGLLLVLAMVWFATLPNPAGRVSADYSFWLPNLLAGYYWYLHNGAFVLPWFSPAECAGMPFQADPQIGYLSLPQWLSFVVDPLRAVQASWLIYGAAGFWGAWVLARRSFVLGVPAALLVASLFLLNSFFSSRMAAGHLTFGAFMLLPAFCAAIQEAGSKQFFFAKKNQKTFAHQESLQTQRVRNAANVLRAAIAGIILALVIQAGMAVVLPEFFCAVLAVLLLHAMRFGWQVSAAWRCAAGTAIGVALSAGKLAAGWSLLAQFPRQTYPLPGIPGVFRLVFVALRSLFWPFSNGLGHLVVNSRLILDPHEFAYGVGLAPPLLLVAALVVAWRGRGSAALRPSRPWPVLAFCLVVLVPLALNLYVPGWNAVLKALPILSSSSNLLRWFVVFMLPAILGAAMAAEYLAAAHVRRAWALAACCVLITVIGLAFADRSSFGSHGMGIYDPAAVVAAWHRAHDTGTVPPITDVVQLFDSNHRVQMTADRQDALVQGFSVLGCYDPLFGYRLENYPFGKIRLAHAMSARDGVLNFKNPACEVFPGANQCVPGDQFTEAQADAAQSFLSYEPFVFAKPWWAVVADWVSLLSLIGTPFVLGWCGWRLRKA